MGWRPCALVLGRARARSLSSAPNLQLGWMPKLSPSSPPSLIAAVRRRALACFVLLTLASACAPELVPIPITQVATATPATVAAPAASGPRADPSGLVSFRMVDEKSGWGITEKSVLRTTDGGVTWRDVSPSKADVFGYSAASDFLDADHGWVLVPDPSDMLQGILYRSGDGGASWSASPVPFGGGDLQFLDFRQGWMLADLGAGAGSMAVAVFQTADAGATWAQSYTNDPTKAGFGNSLPLGGLKNGITPTSPRTAYIGGVTYAPGTVYLYQTADGGQTWSKSSVAAPAGYEEAELQTKGPIFLNASIGYLPIHVSSQNGVLLAIYITGDGGVTWRLAPSLIPSGGSADFVSPQAGLVWNGTNFYVTNDSAQSWRIVAPDVDFTDGFRGMDFVSPQAGFVLTQSPAGVATIYRTLDGGASWNVVGQ